MITMTAIMMVVRKTIRLDTIKCTPLIKTAANVRIAVFTLLRYMQLINLSPYSRHVVVVVVESPQAPEDDSHQR